MAAGLRVATVDLAAEADFAFVVDATAGFLAAAFAVVLPAGVRAADVFFAAAAGFLAAGLRALAPGFLAAADCFVAGFFTAVAVFFAAGLRAAAAGFFAAVAGFLAAAAGFFAAGLRAATAGFLTAVAGFLVGAALLVDVVFLVAISPCVDRSGNSSQLSVVSWQLCVLSCPPADDTQSSTE